MTVNVDVDANMTTDVDSEEIDHCTNCGSLLHGLADCDKPIVQDPSTLAERMDIFQSLVDNGADPETVS